MARVLVVDDDPDSAALMRLVLVEAGFDVQAATCSASALDQIETATLDVLITDCMLHGGPGYLELVRAARRQRPTARIVFVTGMAKEEVLRSGDEIADCTVLQKPIDVDQLIAVVRGAD